MLVCDARFVTAFDIATGKRQRWCDVSHFPGAVVPDPKVPPPADLRYTLTVADDCVLARLGVRDLRPDRNAREVASAGGSFLVCLNRRPDDKGNRLRWRVSPAAAGNAAFEGTAVAGGGRAYIAATRFEEGRAVTAIHCYPLDAREVAPLRWKQDVCTTRELASGEVRSRHHLLTLAGPHVVYCSHSGVIMALDRETGRRTWAVRYRRGRSPGEERPLTPRDLNPCVFAEDKLYVAPADTDQLFCLDPATGRTLWSRERIEVVHLLGVGQGRLIFTTATPRTGLRAVNAEDGSDRGGWLRTSADGSTPLILFGRGLLAGEQVYWPTFHHVYALGQKDGAPLDDPSLLHAVPPGNLAFGNGTLAVADRTTLHIFAPAATRLGARQAAVRQQPESVPARCRLAAAQADAGQFAQAGETLRAAERLAGRPLPDSLRRQRHDLLLRSAEQAADARRWQEAADALIRAADSDFTAAERLQALARLCGVWRQAGQRERAAAVCRAILADKTLTREHLADADGNPQSGRRWALDRLNQFTHPDDLREAVRERKRSDCPPLALPLLRSWRLTLPVGGQFLLPVTEETPGRVVHFFSLQAAPGGRLLRCHDAATGKGLWEHRVPASTSWLGQTPEGVLAAGSERVIGLDARGQLLWEYDAPVRGKRHQALTAFRLVASRLFFLQGGRLFALDAATGRVLWTRWGPSAFLRPPDVARPLAPSYRAGEQTVELPDMRWCLDSHTGKLLRQLPQESPYTVCGREPATGKVLWKYEVPQPTTVTGEPPRLLDVPLGDRRSSLLLIFRNYGTVLQRLDNGKPRWDRPVLFRPDPVWAPGISVDTDAVYFVHAGVLTAVGLDDGRQQWTHPLLATEARVSHWWTRRAGDFVLAYPALRTFSSPVPLSFGALEWGLTLSPGAGIDGSFPVLLCDRKTGKLVQRLNLAGRGPRLWLRWKGTRGPQDNKPAVAVTPGGLVVLLGNKVWGLRVFLERP